MSSNSFLDKALLFKARRKNNFFPEGVYGVMTYCIIAIDKTLAIMFYVPHDQTFDRNWWNVKLYSGYKRSNSQMLHEMYEDHSAIEGDAYWHYKDLGLGSELRATGAMASSGAAHLMIEISKQHRKRL